MSFQAADGWTLVGDFYRGENPQIGILISGGTGFPRQYYRRLAKFLAEKGAIVFTYDYREIGDSASENIADSKVEYSDWGRLDTSAALDILEAQCDGMAITHIAHSVGGHFIGLMPNHAKISKQANIAVGTGYWGHHKISNLLVEFYFWWVMGSASLLLWNYIKPVAGWGGSPLPAGVFKTWRKWSHQSNYFKDEIGTVWKNHFFEDVKTPLRAWVYTDDGIATVKASKELLSCYPNVDYSLIEQSPQEFGLKNIGHASAFRAGREKLWQEWWDWLSADL